MNLLYKAVRALSIAETAKVPVTLAPEELAPFVIIAEALEDIGMPALQQVANLAPALKKQAIQVIVACMQKLLEENA